MRCLGIIGDIDAVIDADADADTLASSNTVMSNDDF
jgi:hypothetical protein